MISADHQNKTDIAASKAREWVDAKGVTMLFGGTNPGTALAICQGGRRGKRVLWQWLVGPDQRTGTPP